MKYGDDYEYANRALTGTWVEYKGEFKYVIQVDGKGNVLFKGELDSCPLDKINVSPIFNGYINFQGTAVYVQRTAKRQWRQGMDDGNMSLPSLYNKWGGKVHFSDCITTNQFPTFLTATSVVGMGLADSVAFHNNWAICLIKLKPRFQLLYKGVGVARLDNITHQYVGEVHMTQRLKTKWEEIRDAH